MEKNNYNLNKDVLTIKTACGHYRFKIEDADLLEKVETIAATVTNEMKNVDNKLDSRRDNLTQYARLLLTTLNICEKYIKLETKYDQLTHTIKTLKQKKPQSKMSNIPAPVDRDANISGKTHLPTKNHPAGPSMQRDSCLPPQLSDTCEPKQSASSVPREPAPCIDTELAASAPDTGSQFFPSPVGHALPDAVTPDEFTDTQEHEPVSEFAAPAPASEVISTSASVHPMDYEKPEISKKPEISNPTSPPCPKHDASSEPAAVPDPTTEVQSDLFVSLDSKPAMCTPSSPPDSVSTGSDTLSVSVNPYLAVPASPPTTESVSSPEVVAPAADIVETSAADIVETSAADIVETPAADIVETPAADIVETSAADVVETSAADIVETSAADVAEAPPANLNEPSRQFIINTPENNYLSDPAPLISDSASGEYQLPLISFLKSTCNKTEVDHQRIRRDAELLEKKLGYFGIKGEVMGVSPGPVITTFEYKPAPGIKISKIVNLADDLALALSAFSIRIVDPIPGKDVMGIEIPNIKKSMVPFIDIITSADFINIESKIPVCLGKDIIGNPVVVKLETMPHLLIAGATGTGKSVGLNAMITSILYKSSPEEVRFLMIDPKRIELSFYNDIPHLLTPVITDMKKANTALQWLVREMDRRYNLLADSQIRNIKQYNRHYTDF